MAKVYRFSYSITGTRSANKLVFESSYEPDVNYDGINAVEIEFENEDNKGVSVALTKAEAIKVFKELSLQGFTVDA
jgi:hypothetical protein